jgi:hypothetical protein
MEIFSLLNGSPEKGRFFSLRKGTLTKDTKSYSWMSFGMMVTLAWMAQVGIKFTSPYSSK